MRSYILFLSILLLGGCIKDDDIPGINTPIKAKVTDYFTGKSLEGQRFSFSECENDGFFISKPCHRIQYFETDNKGEFSFDFINEEDTHYLISYDPDEPIFQWKYMFPRTYRVREGEENNLTFRLKPTATLGIHFIHERSSKYLRMDYYINAAHIRIQGLHFEGLDSAIDTTHFYNLMQEENYELEIVRMNVNREYEKFIKKFRIEKVDSIIVDLQF